MKNLISMTDFVLEQKETSTIDTELVDWYYMEVEKLDKIRRYAKFLKQPLELGMFVPCDEEGNVLEEPTWDSVSKTPLTSEGWDTKYWRLKNEHKQAKERCLFNGFEVVEHPYLPDDKSIVLDEILHVFWHNKITNWNLSMGVFVIEDLVKYNPILTETACSIFGSQVAEAGI